MTQIPRLIRLEKVTSTNTYAEELISKEEVSDGTVIVANEQIAGKGQGDNRWISQPGKNLTMSIVLRPHFLPAEEQFSLNMAISVGIIHFLQFTLPEEKFVIKWPNDIYHEKLKIGGVLISHFLGRTSLDTSVVGIGININQTEFDASLPNPTSIQCITQQPANLDEAVENLFAKIFDQYATLKNNRGVEIRTAYLKNLLGYNTIRDYVVQQNTLQGVIRDVDPFGRLQVESEGGGIKSYAHKEIEYIFQ